MKIKFPKTERILSLSAMIVSILTLIIFIYQTNIINRQSKLSVKPRLSFGITQTTGDSIVSFTQWVKNKGLGPAIVQKANILYKKEQYKLDFDAFAIKKFPQIEEYGNIAETASVEDYTTLSSNETLVIYKFDIPITKLPQLTKYLELDPISLNPKWKFTIQYTSMYEDSVWEINNTDNVPLEE